MYMQDWSKWVFLPQPHPSRPKEFGKVSGWVLKKEGGYQIMWDNCQPKMRLFERDKKIYDFGRDSLGIFSWLTEQYKG